MTEFATPLFNSESILLERFVCVVPFTHIVAETRTSIKEAIY